MSDVSKALSVLLQRSHLLATVQNLPPAVLHKIIHDIGLEDSAELLALTTTEQLVGVFDEDLWANERPGEVETFDPKRFGVWLEVLSELGEQFVASKLAELDEDFFAAALAGQVLVLDGDALNVMHFDDDEAETVSADKLLESSLILEIGQYWLVAKHHHAWDAWSQALTTLDRDHHPLLQRILSRLSGSAEAEIEEQGGLYAFLSSIEQLEEDVAATREDRRSEAGHIAPEQAKAFLSLASLRPNDVSDPISTAYFRHLTEKSAVPVSVPAEWASALPRLAESNTSVSLQDTPLGRAVSDDEGRFVSELAFLANVLMAGHAQHGRRLRPQEAARLAFETANNGYQTGDTPIAAFKRGWAKETSSGQPT